MGRSDAYRWIVPVMLAAGIVLGAACRADDGRPPPHPQPETMADTHTRDEVKAVRKRSGFDDRAMQLDGVVGVGTGGNSGDDSWISVLCADEAACDSARQMLGEACEGVRIEYRATGVIRAQ